MKPSTASSLMVTFGGNTAVKIKRLVNAVHNPVDGTVTSDSTDLIDTLAVIGRVPDSVVDGERILHGDKSLTISAETPVLMSDTIVILGVEYRIVLIDAPISNEQIIYYRVIVRG